MRATSGTAIQQTNCHPFRHGKWLFVHNGVVAGFHEMRRELMLEVAPELFPNIQGSTDSEVLFHLALTYGLEQDPVAALERTLGLVEATAVRHGIEGAVQASIGVTDGERLWAFRYATQGEPRTLFVSSEARHGPQAVPGRRAPAAGCTTRTASWCPSRCPSSRACGTRSPRRRS